MLVKQLAREKVTILAKKKKTIYRKRLGLSFVEKYVFNSSET